MTKEQVIELFKDVEVLVFRDVKQKYFHEDIEEAFKLAIKALKQEPCEDAINREDAINKIEEWADGFEDGEYFSGKSVADAIRACGGIVAELPSVTPSYNSVKTELEQTRWIPVSERLPKEFICDDGYVEPSDYVLVWGDHGNYGVSRYWGNRKTKTENPNSYKDWMDLDWVVQKPIAWMPLPEPYNTESEG